MNLKEWSTCFQVNLLHSVLSTWAQQERNQCQRVLISAYQGQKSSRLTGVRVKTLHRDKRKRNRKVLEFWKGSNSTNSKIAKNLVLALKWPWGELGFTVVCIMHQINSQILAKYVQRQSYFAKCFHLMYIHLSIQEELKKQTWFWISTINCKFKLVCAGTKNVLIFMSVKVNFYPNVLWKSFNWCPRVPLYGPESLSD